MYDRIRIRASEGGLLDPFIYTFIHHYW